MGTPIPAPTRKACAAQASMIVALVWDKPGQNEDPVAIELRASEDLNVVRVSFLNIRFILSNTSHFFLSFLI